MNTRSSPLVVPAGDVTVMNRQSTPAWRLVLVAVAIAAPILIAIGLRLADVLHETSLLLSSAAAFYGQNYLIHDQRLIRRVFGSFEPLVTSFIDWRQGLVDARHEKDPLALLPSAIVWGAGTMFTHMALVHFVHILANWFVAGGLAAGVAAWAIVTEIAPKWAQPVIDRIERRRKRREKSDSPRSEPAATRVRLTLPAGAVKSEKLPEHLSVRGMADVEKFADEFNARTAEMQGPIRTVISIYDDGSFTFTIADEEG